MAYLWDVGALLGALSGVAVAILGLSILPVKPRKPAAVSFSIFAVMWGAAVLAGNMAQLSADVDTGLVWIYLMLLLYLPLHLPLLHFASAYPWPSNRLAEAPVYLVAAGVPAGALALLYAAEPGLFVAGSGVTQAGLPYVVPGPLFDVVVDGNSLLAPLAALGIFFAKLQKAEGEIQRDRLALVTVALLLYISYRGADAIVVGLLDAGASLDLFGAWAFTVFVGSSAACLLGTLVILGVLIRRPQLPRRDLALLAGTVPLLIGLAEGVLRLEGVIGYSTVGLWRLGAVGTFAYAMARYQLFDVELRLRRAVPAAGYVAFTLAGIAVLWATLGSSFQELPALGVAASLGVAAVLAPTYRWSRGAMAGLAPHLGEPEYLYKRKLDVYRAALEEAQGRGLGDETEELFLSELRQSLGISEEEHRVLLLVLESQRRHGRSPTRAPDDRFELQGELGRGSFGRALLAQDTVLDRQVVLKEPMGPWLLDPKGREIFLQEAQLGARLTHPNVVTVYDILDDRDPPTLVLEYMEGGSLGDALKKRGALEPEEALEVTGDLLAGLARIHDAGIIHRDLKPGNLLLTPEGHVKITDFGIAHPPSERQLKVTLATGAAHPGTLAYMSPEQVQGEPLDERSDLYAGGAILYRMLTGEHYLDLEGLSDLQARNAIVSQAPAVPHPSIPDQIEPVLTRALSKDPEQRFASAREMAQALGVTPTAE